MRKIPGKRKVVAAYKTPKSISQLIYDAQEGWMVIALNGITQETIPRYQDTPEQWFERIVNNWGMHISAVMTVDGLVGGLNANKDKRFVDHALKRRLEVMFDIRKNLDKDD